MYIYLLKYPRIPKILHPGGNKFPMSIWNRCYVVLNCFVFVSFQEMYFSAKYPHHMELQFTDWNPIQCATTSRELQLSAKNVWIYRVISINKAQKNNMIRNFFSIWNEARPHSYQEGDRSILFKRLRLYCLHNEVRIEIARLCALWRSITTRPSSFMPVASRLLWGQRIPHHWIFVIYWGALRREKQGRNIYQS